MEEEEKEKKEKQQHHWGKWNLFNFIKLKYVFMSNNMCRKVC